MMNLKRRKEKERTHRDKGKERQTAPSASAPGMRDPEEIQMLSTPLEDEWQEADVQNEEEWQGDEPGNEWPNDGPSNEDKGRDPEKDQYDPRRRGRTPTRIPTGHQSKSPSRSKDPRRTRRHRRDNPSSGSSSSSGRSRSGGRKRRSHKSKRHARSYSNESSDEYDRNIKMKHPETYDGKADLEAFDNWVNSILTYAEVMKIRENTMINMMSSYVSGTAQNFYTKYVNGRAKKWTFDTLFPDLFTYCFPPEIMRKLRARWNNLNQGKRRVRDYIREIELLSGRFKEMNDRTIILKFWEGLNWELRETMASTGVDPEEMSLEQIIRKAEDAEKGRDQRNYERSQRQEGGRRPKRDWTRFKNRTGGNQNYKPGNQDDKQGGNKTDKVRANAVSPPNAPKQKPKQGNSNSNQNQNQNRNRNPNNNGNYQRGLSRAQLDTLKAEGKCFNCLEKGHRQQDCPKLNSMKPPKNAIKAGSISVSKLDKLADSDAEEEAEEESDGLYVGNVRIETDPIQIELNEFEEVEFRVHQLCEEAWGSDPLWHNEETRHDSRWSICADEHEVTVWNFETGGIRTFERNILNNPSFDIVEIFNKPEANRTPTSVREGGYPDLGDYNRWEWPAINWMTARLRGQLEFVDEDNAPLGVKAEDRINIQPTMKGYSIQLDESDIVYHITHEEVLDKHFSPERIINELLEARRIPAEWRGNKFEDKRLTSYVMLMLGMTTIPGQQNKIKKRGTKKRVIDPDSIPAIERTTLRIKDKTRKLPEPIIVQAKVNGHTVRALLDTGSMADFISTTVVEQLKLPKEVYQKPLPVQLAVHGSRSKINCGTTVRFQYQLIDCDRRFDIVNLDNYDMILGTPFMYQHQVAIGFNPSRVLVGSNEPMEMKGPEVVTINSAAMDVVDQGLKDLRLQLKEEAEDLCPDTSKTALPPLREVNHIIPLIDERKIYRFRPSKCPEAFREQWTLKKDAYINSGRWKHATGRNAIPLLMIPKMSSSGGKPTLRTVFDKREQNANTHKLASPLPDIEQILREVSRHKYRSLIDGKDAYEQIRVVPEHVSRMIFTTPDGTMVSCLCTCT